MRLGPVGFWGLRGAFWGYVYNTKVVVNVPKSAWQQGQGIGLEGPAGPWKANSGYPHILLVSNQILSLNTIFNTYFESSRATPGNPS